MLWNNVVAFPFQSSPHLSARELRQLFRCFLLSGWGGISLLSHLLEDYSPWRFAREINGLKLFSVFFFISTRSLFPRFKFALKTFPGMLGGSLQNMNFIFSRYDEALVCTHETIWRSRDFPNPSLSNEKKSVFQLESFFSRMAMKNAFTTNELFHYV